MTIHAHSSTPTHPGSRAWFRRFTPWLVFGLVTLCGLALLLVPPVRARPVFLGTQRVIINEVAWMGTAANFNHEWIELYNPGAEPVSIDGWSLQAKDGTPNITIGSGSIPANGYFLLERSTDEAISNIAADIVYTGALQDEGETLELHDSANNLIDTANFNGTGWPAGRITPSRCSMERIGPLLDQSEVWVTSSITGVGIDSNGNPICGSPKSQNTQFITPTATPEWQRRLLINEVAWGGTRADDIQAQWIELYNPGENILLDNFYLRIPGKGDIPLPAGTLSAGGYFLIVRNETDIINVTVDELVLAFPLLNPAGDSLYLYAPDGSLVDTANAAGGPWPAGNRFYNYASMERRSNEPDNPEAWLTFWGTPLPGTPLPVDRLGHPINGSPGQPNSSGATSTPTLTASPTATSTPTPTLTPSPTPGTSREVVINEVAWMGTAANANHEWIELYNTDADAINLTGWRLATTDNTFSITLNGSIPGHGYFLLERTSDNTVSDIAADQIYTGALANEGRALRLLSPSNQVIDTANGNGGAWPAGSVTSYCSMERRAVNGVIMADSDFAWITNTGVLKNGKDANGNDICGTPKNINWAFYVTPTPTPLKTSIPTRLPGTPTPNRATPEAIVINEFLPHPRSDWNNDGVIDSGDAFIELINLGSVAVTLNNYRLDDQEGDSPPYTISGVTLQPGTRRAFFTSETGILLSDGGDSVRLFKPSGQLGDAFTYGVVKELDRAWCRYPDGIFISAGQSNWTFGCQPSPDEANQLASTQRVGLEDLPLVCRSPKLPFGIYLAECDRIGLWNWNSALPPQPVVPPHLEAGGTLFFFE